MSHSILIVDDEKPIAKLIETLLKEQNETYDIHAVHFGQDGVEFADENHPVLALLDIHLPDMNGLQVLEKIKKVSPETHILMVSGTATLKMAIESMRMGAYDFIEKPFEPEELKAKVRRIFERYALEQEVTSLKKELGAKYKFKALVGNSPAMKKVFESIEIACKSSINVLITGESGTGKELVARAIHYAGQQKNGPFVAVDCGAIPVNLLESELYGYEKGAFTGASGQKPGKFEQAQGGTVFLDEIGELPLEEQVKLLRVLQEREIQRLGGNKPIGINARFIAATNRDLQSLIKEGKFREDLYFRLHVLPVYLPSLRERLEDIPALFKYFSARYAGENSQVEIEESALDRLLRYDWPGNIRELENVVERLMLTRSANGIISSNDITALALGKDSQSPSLPNPSSPQGSLDDAEKQVIQQTLQLSGGNISKAAKTLQISRDTLYRKIRKYAISL